MGELVYAMNVSLDGYVEDAGGGFDFTEPQEEVHRHWNRHSEEASAFLYGRRLYELMESHWPAAAARDDLPEVEAEFARAYVQTPRIVFSDTLDSVGERSRLVRSVDAVQEVRRLKDESDGPLALGGPSLAATLLDLVDEFRVCVAPIAVGGGKPFFPAGQRLPLRLVEQWAFPGGTVYLRYERER